MGRIYAMRAWPINFGSVDDTDAHENGLRISRDTIISFVSLFLQHDVYNVGLIATLVGKYRARITSCN